MIIYFDTLFGGTEKTLNFCITEKIPYILIDATELTPQRTAKRIEKFITHKSIVILNIAGPRESDEPLAYTYTLKSLQHYLSGNE